VVGRNPVRRLANLATAVAVAVAACQSSPPHGVVRGVITDLQVRDIAHADWVTVETETRQVLQFKVADSVGFPPSHLREHMLFREPVTVTYIETPDGPLATEMTD
jgi:hypothetical protein